MSRWKHDPTYKKRLLKFKKPMPKTWYAWYDEGYKNFEGYMGDINNSNEGLRPVWFGSKKIEKYIFTSDHDKKWYEKFYIVDIEIATFQLKTLAYHISKVYTERDLVINKKEIDLPVGFMDY